MDTAIFLLNILQIVGAYKKYSFHDNELTWDESQMACEKDGGYLLTMQSADVANILRKELSGYEAEVWIGMRTDNNDCSGYTWHSGEHFLFYRNWAQSEPNYCAYDRCIRMHLLKWKTSNCRHTYKYICETNIDEKNDITTITSDEVTTDNAQTTDAEGMDKSLDLEVNISASMLPTVSNGSGSLNVLPTSEEMESSTNAADKANSAIPFVATDDTYADSGNGFSNALDVATVATDGNSVGRSFQTSDSLVSTAEMIKSLMPSHVLPSYDVTGRISDTGLISVMGQMKLLTTTGDVQISDVINLESGNLLTTDRISVTSIDNIDVGDATTLVTTSTSRFDFSSNGSQPCCYGKNADLVCGSIVWDSNGISKTLKAEIKRLQEELRVAKNSTKIYIRSKRSIYEESLRSVSLGILGILLIVTVVSLILMSDLVTFIVFIRNLRQHNSIGVADAA